jgi:hypothetical protein
MEALDPLTAPRLPPCAPWTTASPASTSRDHEALARVLAVAMEEVLEAEQGTA